MIRTIRADIGDVKADIRRRVAEHRHMASDTDKRRSYGYDPETAARMRAALAYKGLGVGEAAGQFGVAERTIYRWTRAESPIPLEVVEQAAQLTGVPLWFLRHGFEPPHASDDPDLAERVAALEQQIATIVRLLTGNVSSALVERATELAAPEGSQHPAGTGPPEREDAGR